MKGIILAGGSGTRLYPVTKSISKQIIPIYDKPMIFYPLSVLMNAGIKEILVISTPNDIDLYETLLGDGSNLGLSISYKIQPSPDGLAQAFILGEEFIGESSVCLVLGDNVFYGKNFEKTLPDIVEYVNQNNKSVVFGYQVNDPERYGVVEFDDKNNVVSIEEKPKEPKSNYAVVGLYFYTNDVIKISKEIKPSQRGELEITSVNEHYLKKHKLSVKLLDNDTTWLDTGTFDSLLEASQFVKTIQKRNSSMIASPEEIALIKGFISGKEFLRIIKHYKNNEYGKYLTNLINKWITKN